MAGDRTLKLTLLADTKKLVDGLNKGEISTADFAKTVSNASAKAVKAFAAIGVAVGAASLAFAKAAAEDQASANRLAQTLGNLTNATQKQIATVATYIDKTELATGIADDQLRPAFERLARSTKSVEESQTLLNLALDISAATGKPLEAVTNALAKAYDGSFTSLQRLGLGVDANIIKTKDFDKLYNQLNGTMGDFSEKRSEEAIVKFERLQRAIGQAREAIGAALLPVFEKLGDWLLNTGVPRLQAFVAGLVGDKSLSSGFDTAQKEAEQFGKKLRGIIDTVIEFRGVIGSVAAILTTIWAVSTTVAAINTTINAIKGLIAVYQLLKAKAAATAVAQLFALNPLVGAAGAAALIGAITFAANKAANAVNDIGNQATDVTEGLQYDERGYLISSGVTGGGKLPGGSSTNQAVDFGTSYTSSGTGGGGGGTGQSLGGYSSVEEMFKRLQAIDQEVKDLTFKYNTGQISKAQAQKAVDALAKETSMIESAAKRALGGSDLQGQYGAFQPMDPNKVTYGGGASIQPITINVNAPSMMDETGFARAVQRAIKASEDRGTFTGGL